MTPQGLKHPAPGEPPLASRVRSAKSLCALTRLQTKNDALPCVTTLPAGGLVRPPSRLDRKPANSRAPVFQQTSRHFHSQEIANGSQPTQRMFSQIGRASCRERG